MKKQIPLRYLWMVRLFIAILLGILAYLAFILVVQYRYIAREQAAHGKRVQISNFRKHRALTIQDISLIESWMTFDYIATAFRVPATFLQTSLNIIDPKYPRVTLYRYAKTHGLDPGEFTLNVIDTVGKFFVGTTTSTNR